MLKSKELSINSKKSLNKSLQKSQSSASLKRKNSSSHPKSNSKRKDQSYQINIEKDHLKKLNKKSQKPTMLVKKKIEDLRTPDIIIKISYKGKRVSIPINNVDDKSLKQTVIPHISRFQKQILKNLHFNQSSIENWKTIGQGDILKDFYFQTNKPISVFKGQVLQIQPIWKQIKVQPVTLQHFQIIKCIGTGGFSRVFLARYRANGKFYALKLMEKEGLLQSGKQCVVTNERDIMVQLHSPFVLSLDFAFQTKHFVALALEYCPGGQLFYYLRKIRRMNEDEARYCFIQILLGIQYLHSKNIIYRDIKPENIMIDEDGNLKIADFGLSKMGIKQTQMAFTYCGSPQYMAPEMLTKSGHSFSVDYYCLGALLYELVTGNPPFYSRDVDKIYFSIQNQQIDFPNHVQLSQEIKMLLQGLLIKDPKRRLGSLGGIREILAHPWVRKLKTTDIINKNIPTPIKIDLLKFNINEQQIEEGEGNFEYKFQQEGLNFQPMFQDFYFSKFTDISNILEKQLADGQYLPSVKSDSTKQNKSLNIKYSKESLNNPNSSHHSSNKRQPLGIKSALSRQKNEKYSIQINNSKKHATSQINRQSSIKPKLKKQKSKKQLNLIQRSKKRVADQKSVNRLSKKDKINKNGLQRSKSPKNIGNKATLKRIKSSTALINGLTQKKYF